MYTSVKTVVQIRTRVNELTMTLHFGRSSREFGSNIGEVRWEWRSIATGFQLVILTAFTFLYKWLGQHTFISFKDIYVLSVSI